MTNGSPGGVKRTVEISLTHHKLLVVQGPNGPSQGAPYPSIPKYLTLEITRGAVVGLLWKAVREQKWLKYSQASQLGAKRWDGGGALGRRKDLAVKCM